MDTGDQEVLTLNREGEWLADGQPISHGPTRRLFSKSLKREPDGTWWIEVGREKKQVDVEDTAYFVTRIEGSAEAGYDVFLNDETGERLSPETLRYTDGRLTCVTLRGFEAKFLRPSYSDFLLQCAEESEGNYFVKIEGHRYSLNSASPAAILFFDGVCGLCNRAVDFLMKVDRQSRLSFAPLQGRTAAALLSAPLRTQLDTVVLSVQGKCYVRSDAILRAVGLAGGVWWLAKGFLLIPRKWRDQLYDWVASNRYSWFGKREQCRLPTPTERSRILE